MKKLVKTMLILFAALLCLAGAVQAECAEVEWNMDALTTGELSVTLSGAEDGLTAVLALYDGDTLVSVSRKTVVNSATELSADVKNAENGIAKLMLWDWNNLRPASGVLSIITPEGITPEPLKVGSISGLVWNDANGDGIRNEAEGAEDIEAVLIKDETEIANTTTDENGMFTFNEVVVGEYTVSVAVPYDTEPLADTAASVIVEENKTVTVEFGFKPVIHVGTVTGVVWVDEDGDGKVGSDELGVVESAEVIITDSEDNEVARVETDAEGSYIFKDVLVGEYTVSVIVPEEMEATTPAAVKVTVTEDDKVNVFFGLRPIIKTGTITGIVWIDTDGDGEIGNDETERIAGAKVTLKNEDTTVSAATTKADGAYVFEDIPLGTYTMSVTDPEEREPTTVISAEVTVMEYGAIEWNFGFEPIGEIWVSDNQVNNRPSSVGYHNFDPITEEYVISFKLKILKKGDNAILLGDSSNGGLIYKTSSVTLLFNGDKFAVKNGDGKGNYSPDVAKNICDANEGETYTITFKGNIAENKYTVSITGKDSITYTSEEVSARTNGTVLDTIAVVNNSLNTVVDKNGNYSGYRFFIRSFNAETIVDDPVYSGFAGMYYGLKVNGKYARGNNGRITADWSSIHDDSAQFLPRDMADGSFAFMCRSSDRRITTTGLNSQLASSDYAYNDDTQHWIMEESENYSETNLSYYLKSKDNGMYIGLSGDYLTAVNAAKKVEVVFVPLYDDSPMYQASQTEAYAMLTKAQRNRIETMYETLAGDVFDRYGNTIVGAEWTARIRLDNLFNDMLSGSKDTSEQLDALNSFLNTTNGYLINNTSSYPLDSNLPGTAGEYCGVDKGVYGNYDLWRGSMSNGTKYKLTIYNSDGSVQQTMDLYVEDHDDSRANAEYFKEAIVQIPYTYRRYIKTVKIRVDTANSFNCGASDLYIRVIGRRDTNTTRNLIAHELSHSVDMSNGYWSQGGGWSKAMADDMIMVSGYANTSAYEDFAEFGKLYFISSNNRDRQKALQILFPNRYASYWRLRNNNLGGFRLWEDTEYLE